MKILYSSQPKAKLYSPSTYKKQNNIKFSGNENEIQKSLIFTENYNRPFISKITSNREPKSFDLEKIQKLGIPNFCITNHNGVRGETLSSPKNRKFLKPLKKSGIRTIIDLRDKFPSSKFEDLCKEHNFKYYRFPIDASSIPDETIIKDLSKFFELLDDGDYYIACAQGLHRTDIALALNYTFNPKATEPPFLIGHIRGEQLKTDDINRRLNSVFKKLTAGALRGLGWDEYNADTFAKRKKIMYSMNRKFFNLR